MVKSQHSVHVPVNNSSILLLFYIHQDLSLGLSGHTTDEEMPTPEECITKIGALLRVFTTVMRSLGEYFMPDKGPAVTVDFMTGV